MVYRVYVEKKEALRHEANALLSEINTLLGMSNVTGLRIINRYDVEDLSKEIFDYAVKTILSEPQLDDVYDDIPADGAKVFAVEFLPGQFDQRANSAAECIQLVSKGERPTVASAKVYLVYGSVSDADVDAIKKYVVNPVEARVASLELPETLKAVMDLPTTVDTLTGFLNYSESELAAFVSEKGLAMDLDDIKFCQDYFKSEDRDPTITEIRMIDTYWSDHCRHTTFLTTIDSVKFDDSYIQEAYDLYIASREKLGRTKPINLMDIGTLAAKVLKSEGKLQKLDESEEINACTVKMTINHDGKDEDWLLLFKNETHNHPTEIEPFGGAATCIGGAIRDPLSGRSYVYGAMRVTGAADPTKPLSETLKGKLPQRKLVTTAANGYSSYGNQIGLATGQVDELYHDGYAAKRMEIGAVIAATPAANVRREVPDPGDIVILLGGRTGRDGCGGATGSSKSHNLNSLDTCGAEVQKGNAPEERKLQRLFRNAEASRLIRRCNDFGAGGVSVAIGELADGLLIDLDKVPKKYEGLDGTELAISESQERMAVVVESKDVDRFIEIANSENLEATVVATVTEKPYLTMTWKGNTVVNISREFLNSNGAEKHIDVHTKAQCNYAKEIPSSFVDGYKALVGDLNVCSKRGLSERFDSTIGAGGVLMPFGGKYQRTPVQAMVNKVSVEHGDTDTASLMAYGFNPYIMEKDQFHGAYLAVVESISKLIAHGATFEDVYLTFQEYFEKPNKAPERWGKPLAALLGAFKAQLDFECAAIGGKDSMSGSFEDLDVPPTLCSFAVTTDKISRIISNDFKAAGHRVACVRPEYDEFGVPKIESLKKIYAAVSKLIADGTFVAAYTPTYGGIAEAIYKMCIGNGVGFDYGENYSMKEIFEYNYGAFILELKDHDSCPFAGMEGFKAMPLGFTSDKPEITFDGQSVTLAELSEIYENKLESVFPCNNIPTDKRALPTFSYDTDNSYKAVSAVSKPRVLIPVFPGTNCEYDTAKAFERAGAEAKIFVINNLDSKGVEKSVSDFAQEIKNSQIIFIPGGFSGGDEPEGSAKFITSFFRNPEIKDAVTDLLENRDGLMGGICNGFQALIKLGLVPYGKIIDTDENCPTLSYNTISRHQSKIVGTKLCSNNSPWLKYAEVGKVYNVPISHGEGRIIASDDLLMSLAENGQILTQYVDLDGNPTSDIQYNPNGSALAVEGLLSPDGRVFGKMGHAERIGTGLYKNVPGDYDLKLFESAVAYYNQK
ncbi:MAG: phosphoribosylformylglycinamidine synthase [Oscillospiraceae bacterium]|nr:phosphoribosylformylglycinamidine synthase [Candidatus Limimonas egerieequi]